MPSPFTWDITKPAGTDPQNIGDDQIRADKATLRDVLRTLVPFGTATTGWRAVQIGNDAYLTLNAYYDGTNWQRDDTTLMSIAIKYQASNGNVIVQIAQPASNPIAAWRNVASFFAGNVAAANFVQLIADVTGASPKVAALGDDANLDLLLVPKGTGQVRVASNPLRLAANPVAAMDAATKQYVDGLGASQGPIFLNRVAGIVEVVNTTSEIDLYTFTIPGGTLGSNRAVLFTMHGDIQKGAAGGPVWTIRIYYGGSLLLTLSRAPSASSTARQMLFVEAELVANGAASWLTARGVARSSTAQTPGASINDVNADPGYIGAYSYRSDITIDSSVDRVFRVTGQWDTASTVLSIRRLNARLVLY
jgi:hypothetical protein